MLTDRNSWMRTKPMDKQLYYVCHSTDRVKSLPWTPNRERSISTMFHDREWDAQLALKNLLEERVNGYVCRIVEIEQRLHELAKDENERKNQTA